MMNCKTFAWFGIWFALANMLLAILGIDAPVVMTVLMELCFVAIFCALVCLKDEIEANQKTILNNQSSIVANQEKIKWNQEEIKNNTRKA